MNDISFGGWDSRLIALPEAEYILAEKFFPGTTKDQHLCGAVSDQEIFRVSKEGNEALVYNVKFERMPCEPNYGVPDSDWTIIWRRLPSSQKGYRLGVFSEDSLKQINPLCEFTGS